MPTFFEPVELPWNSALRGAENLFSEKFLSCVGETWHISPRITSLPRERQNGKRETITKGN